MSSSTANPYERAKGGRLTFKGGNEPTATKSTNKNKKKKKIKKIDENDAVEGNTETPSATAEAGGGCEDVYTIDAAKKRKYDELFPVEAKKFGYYKDKEKSVGDFKSVEDVLDDRVKKKADRYCK
ncbi:uncharacterized protein LOC126669312 [Mercurialis annua]|uniref:uncharacterized protein LOC126669312 n=1 Tax=Mercurialis annua TaxID=3986 RepID=UPI00215F92B3|nr:uncharacterized protein LOC126669312 [Mercurialis annua]